MVDLPAGIDFSADYLFSNPPVRKYPLPSALVLELLVAATIGPRREGFLTATVRSATVCHWRPLTGPSINGVGADRADYSADNESRRTKEAAAEKADGYGASQRITRLEFLQRRS